MRHLVFITLLVGLAVTASLGTTSAACPSYEAAVNYCHSVIGMTSSHTPCEFWSCVTEYCGEPFVRETQQKHCYRRPNIQVPTRNSKLPSSVALQLTPLSDATPAVASPCGGGSGAKNATEIRHWLLDAAMNVYYDRNSEHYTEGDQRWSGITGNVCPPSAPPYSDCSSTVTWIYWTLFGNGPDFMNQEAWKAGYTGTLDQNGRNVTISTAHLAIGDLCFYYTPMHHVAMYVGGGMVVSHGMDPVGYYPYNYAPIDFCRRYI
eukprot:CAMPEP_0176443066 /NCGR_PEP_ID=MMETSP0127-20121128/22198_1 /TAXON_ID=938130 /ORGANISM="Platyophrya macrostoma, Strain WH" /LENGTH=261 /DNA_ID=CAMNT_0017828217 /DNA_START=26 /DNA_END=811 /DNA_ORIENTATION=+